MINRSAAGPHPWPPLSSAATPLDYLPALKGDYFRHESKNVGRPFHIYVAFPESYAAQPQARYPVVFLLDGDSTFPILVVISGSRNPPRGRQSAMEWFKAWEGRTDGSWQLTTVTLDGGTHAADITNGYRAGMIWLFARDGKRQQTPSASH